MEATKATDRYSEVASLETQLDAQCQRTRTEYVIHWNQESQAWNGYISGKRETKFYGKDICDVMRSMLKSYKRRKSENIEL